MLRRRSSAYLRSKGRKSSAVSQLASRNSVVAGPDAVKGTPEAHTGRSRSRVEVKVPRVSSTPIAPPSEEGPVVVRTCLH